jgi:hypothetical protein
VFKVGVGPRRRRDGWSNAGRWVRWVRKGDFEGFFWIGGTAANTKEQEKAEADHIVE